MYGLAAQNIGKEEAGTDYIDNIANVVPPINETQAKLASVFVASLREANGSISDEKLREMLRKRDFPNRIVEEAIRRARPSGGDQRRMA